MSAAARVGDPIEHTSALEGLLLGLAVGAAAVVVAAAAGVTIVATGGLAAVAAVGAVMALSAGFGELIGSLSWCTNKAGQIFKGSGNVFTNGKPAARAHVDTATCDKHGSVPQVIAQGSRTVHINGQPAARVGDRTVCDGKISAGSGNVNIGGPTEQTDDINPEVEPWLHWLVGGIGFGSAVVLTSPLIAITAFIDGAVLGGIGNILGGRWFGEDSDEQKAMTFGGAVLGGWFGARYEVKQEGLGSLFGNLKVTPRTPVGPKGVAGDGVDLSLTYKSGWTDAQRAAADAKVKILNDADTVLTVPVRSGTSAASRYKQAGNTVPKGSDVDHMVDLQLGGTDTIPNMSPLDLSVNRSLGAQIYQQTKSLPPGTKINNVKIGD
jgi:uncharacterized Zn-binding protein involved in type VI secretion